MDAFKKFLKDKKTNKHFKQAGQGQTLGSGGGQSSSSGSGPAARPPGPNLAALRRYEAQHEEKETDQEAYRRKIELAAKRELEKEKQRASGTVPAPPPSLEATTKSSGKYDEPQPSGPLSVDGVFFDCELIHVSRRPKHEVRDELANFLSEQLENGKPEDRLFTSLLILYSLNREEQRKIAVDTISKYLKNVVEQPGEAKFRRIRLSNKAFQERVASIRGARNVLEAVGFEETLASADGASTPEPFLVLQQASDSDEETARLLTALDALSDDHVVPIRVARDTKVFTIDKNSTVPRPNLPAAFYELTSDDVRSQQDKHSADVEKIMTLRTKEMRERDEKGVAKEIRYSLIRVRFAEGYLLQGTFGADEPLASVYEWIYGHLTSDAAFTLVRPVPGGGNLSVDSSLRSLGLAPSALLHLDTLGNTIVLKPDVVANAETLGS